MIQPGQKLKEGDYVKDPKTSELTELYKICSVKNYSLVNFHDMGFMYQFCVAILNQTSGKLMLGFNAELKINEYSYEDFKQLCENTFNSEPPKPPNDRFTGPTKYRSMTDKEMASRFNNKT